jgi:hypothetical protein
MTFLFSFKLFWSLGKFPGWNRHKQAKRLENLRPRLADDEDFPVKL